MNKSGLIVTIIVIFTFEYWYARFEGKDKLDAPAMAAIKTVIYLLVGFLIIGLMRM